jgi:hypothetical protein
MDSHFHQIRKDHLPESRSHHQEWGIHHLDIYLKDSRINLQDIPLLEFRINLIDNHRPECKMNDHRPECKMYHHRPECKMYQLDINQVK